MHVSYFLPQEVLRFWLEKGVDGFRVDAVRHLYETKDFLKDQQPSKIPNTSPVSEWVLIEFTHLLQNWPKNLPKHFDFLLWKKVFTPYNCTIISYELTDRFHENNMENSQFIPFTHTDAAELKI